MVWLCEDMLEIFKKEDGEKIHNLFDHDEKDFTNKNIDQVDVDETIEFDVFEAGHLYVTADI